MWIHEKEDEMRAVELHMLKSAMSLALRQWRDACGEHRREGEDVAKCIARWQQSSMFWGLLQWRGAVHEIEVLRRCCRSWEQTALSKAFRTWVSFIVEGMEQEEQAAIMIQYP